VLAPYAVILNTVRDRFSNSKGHHKDLLRLKRQAGVYIEYLHISRKVRHALLRLIGKESLRRARELKLANRRL